MSREASVRRIDASVQAPSTFRLRPDDDPATGLLRVLRSEIEAAAATLVEPDLPQERAIHATRRHIKRARTANRLLKSTLRRARMRALNAALRDAAQKLAGDREADVLVALAARLAEGASKRARPALVAVGARTSAGSRHHDVASNVALSDLADAREIAAAIELQPDSTEQVAKEMGRLYAKGRKAMRRARENGGEEAFHEWRKRVKDRWHAARVMKRLWPASDRPKVRRLDELGETLGADHDLAVLAQALEAARAEIGPNTTDAALAFVSKQQTVLRRRILAQGRKLYRRSGKDVAEMWSDWPSNARSQR